MSHFAEYKLEREGKRVIETEEGFVSYSINGVDCYIEDIFVSKHYRRSSIATKMADLVAEIARGNGCKLLFGSVVPKANGSHQSMLAILSYGFKLYESRENIVFFVKEL
jgi:GNAT superfamily N-acetyltransferase